MLYHIKYLNCGSIILLSIFGRNTMQTVFLVLYTLSCSFANLLHVFKYYTYYLLHVLVVSFTEKKYYRDRPKPSLENIGRSISDRLKFGQKMSELWPILFFPSYAVHFKVHQIGYWPISDQTFECWSIENRIGQGFFRDPKFRCPINTKLVTIGYTCAHTYIRRK